MILPNIDVKEELNIEANFPETESLIFQNKNQIENQSNYSAYNLNSFYEDSQLNIFNNSLQLKEKNENGFSPSSSENVNEFFEKNFSIKKFLKPSLPSYSSKKSTSTSVRGEEELDKKSDHLPEGNSKELSKQKIKLIFYEYSPKDYIRFFKTYFMKWFIKMINKELYSLTKNKKNFFNEPKTTKFSSVTSIQKNEQLLEMTLEDILYLADSNELDNNKKIINNLYKDPEKNKSVIFLLENKLEESMSLFYESIFFSEFKKLTKTIILEKAFFNHTNMSFLEKNGFSKYIHSSPDINIPNKEMEKDFFFKIKKE